jgi:hypothetical protein
MASGVATWEYSGFCKAKMLNSQVVTMFSLAKTPLALPGVFNCKIKVIILTLQIFLREGTILNVFFRV